MGGLRRSGRHLGAAHGRARNRARKAPEKGEESSRKELRHVSERAAEELYDASTIDLQFVQFRSTTQSTTKGSRGFSWRFREYMSKVEHVREVYDNDAVIMMS